MARYTDAKCKLCRREGEKLFLKGDRCYSSRCAIETRNYPPGVHGRRRQRRRRSDYGFQLREKQKLRRIYGLLERQFRNTFQKAASRPGKTGENLLQLLERRLDNMIFRMGFAPSRAAARQLIRHNHIVVNGRRVNIPSYLVKPGEEVALREKSRELFVAVESLKNLDTRGKVSYIEVDRNKRSGVLSFIPTRDLIPIVVEEQLVVELYSK
jgi:small subunit ribosomal protein S4